LTIFGSGVGKLFAKQFSDGMSQQISSLEPSDFGIELFKPKSLKNQDLQA
jgi:hypothetical protein